MAIWLEVFIDSFAHAALTPFLFGFSCDTQDPQGADLSKHIIADILGGKVFESRNQVGGGSEPLGTHSIRKLEATHIRRSGATKDERDICGRWKGKARVGDVYDDVELPFPDLKVASLLCNGGPCRYELEAHVDEAFIFSNVVPNICKRFNEETALIFGTVFIVLKFLHL